MMKVLALDTTTRAGSVALVEDGRVVDERAGDPARTHAERLPRELQALLDDHGIESADVDCFAVASGPGSFTGLRIGIATMQGLAFVHRRHIVPVSALDALAWIGRVQADGPDSLVAAWMDAHRGDVFSALYRIGPAEPSDPPPLIELDGAQVGEPGATLDRWEPILRGHQLTIIGDGATQRAQIILDRHPDARILEHPMLAGAIARIAAARAATGAAIDAAAVRPLYVRRPDAEIERDRKALATEASRDAAEKPIIS